MKLAELLADVPTDELVRMARELARVDKNLGGPQLRATLEGVLKSHRFLQDFIVNRQPPTFAILTVLLETDNYAVSVTQFPSLVQAETTRICVGVDAGLIVGRDDQLRIYRKVFQQARANDYQIDTVEASLLTVLRQELGIAQVEHFLIEHHADLREFWRTSQLVEREFEALRAAGILFVRDGMALIPKDQVANLRRVLGIDMSRIDARRLFGYLTSTELHDALALVGLPTGGNKDDRVARLITNMIQPRTILASRVFGIDRLRDVCREIGAAVSGAKDELVSRIIDFVSADKDIAPPPQQPEPIREEHRLDRERFGLLFETLKSHGLTSLLIHFELKRSGTKDIQIETLWDAARSELTLLSVLGSGDLEGMLKSLELKSTGSKSERIERLVSHFAVAALEPETPDESPSKREAYQAFFQGLIDELREQHHFTNARAAQPQNWYAFASGTRGFVYGLNFANGAKLRAEVYVDLGDRSKNVRAFEALRSESEIVEREYGAPLHWELLNGKRACRVASYTPGSIAEPPHVQESHRRWAVEHLLKLKKVFGPRLPSALVAADE